MKQLIVILASLVAAGPADAGPVFVALLANGATLGAAFGATALGGFLASTIGRLALSAAIAAYQKRRMKKKLAAQQSGITTQYTGTGGTTPLSVILGTYASGGHLEAPQNSQPTNSSPPQAYLTYVIGLGDVAPMELTGRVVINDEWHTFSAVPTPGLEEYGVTVEGDLANLCWFRFRNGSQTEADPFLLAKFGADPERPWLDDMIGRGIPQVIATFKRDPDRFPGEPRLRFEVRGIPLYDPRSDSTVGGDGGQRWSDPATWAYTDNPKVIEYNIHRGIEVQGYGKWGNAVAADDLPLANWIAAMNACDLLVSDGADGFEPSYHFGFEFTLDTSPAQIIDEINRSCGGETVEIGGVYKTRVGGVGLPVFFFTDGDIVVSRPQDYDPFPGLEETFNAVTCSFPDPALLWEAREAPPLTNADWEAQDGTLEFDESSGSFVRQPRRLMSPMSLPGVSNPRQVQRLMAAYAAEGRKRRTHSVTLTPSALVLEPLDAVAWTSARNGYDGKVFDVVMTIDPVVELRPRLGLIEADPADYTPPALVPMPVPSTAPSVISDVPVVGFAAAPFAALDALGTQRRPGVKLTWDVDAMADVPGLRWELRVAATGQIAAQGTVQDPTEGEVIIAGLLPAVDYEARAMAITDRPALWSVWIAVTTPDIKLGRDDLATGVVVQSLGPTSWLKLSPAIVLGPTSGVTSIAGVSIVDASGPAGAQQVYAAIRCELTAAVPRWITLRVTLGWSGGNATVEQPLLLRPAADLELSFAAPAETVAGVTSVTLSARADDLDVSESITLTHARYRAYSMYR